MGIEMEKNKFCYVEKVTEYFKARGVENPESWLSGFDKKIYDSVDDCKMKMVMVNDHFRKMIENHPDKGSMAVRGFIMQNIPDFVWYDNYRTRVLPYVITNKLC